jgi:hydroxyacylglutathione hydrolase
MAPAEVAKRYFEALNAHDLDRAVQCWMPGGIERVVGAKQELEAPHAIRQYFAALFAAFPDWRFEVLDTTTSKGRTAVRWRGDGTFAGPSNYQGFAPNGARVEIEGCDVLTVSGDLIESNDAYVDSGDIARQLGFLPPAGSPAEARLARLANVRTRLQTLIRGAEPERIADGVWILRGGFPPKIMNVYLIRDGGKVTVFDAGSSDMSAAIAAAAARLGGIERVVLGHADADHRGAAPALRAPTSCHPEERAAAESDATNRPYWDFSKLDPHGRFLLSRLLPVWDGGAVAIADTVQEGDEVAGFKVIDLPGHAPGLIGLYREADKLALVSDCIYTLDPQTGWKGPARVPHPAFNCDTEQARASIRKLASLEPAVVWAGHTDPVTGDVSGQLERAASA